ncbi:hypothetical protein [Micromonospora sp. MA102]|uniref:hypothetical protein n=1 Tax=Micromonospora sp. MA102 TaxID=2952755 RepID=UPI0021CA9BD8|nr:hypothetical protein [Micromonospora sp. MA102]
MAVVVVAVVAASFILLSCAGWWLYANHDRPELIDSPEVAEVAESACTTMQAAVAARAAPSNAAIDVRVRSIRDQNAAVVAMVARVRGLGSKRLDDDRPTAAWLSDWEALIEVREQYARDLAAGGKRRFAVPTDDGVPITDRMNHVGLACQVPPMLLDLW